MSEWGIEEGRRFARRIYLPRVAGVALVALCVGGGLWEAGAPPWVWALLALQTLAWPHLAYRLALRSRDPHRAELRNLMLDSAGGGVWIAAMHFSLAPSAVLAAMLAMDKAAVGGTRFLARGLAAQVAAAAVVALAASIEPQLLQSGNVARIASLPLLLFYPVMVGLTAYRLARRVRHQNDELRTLSATDGLTGLPHHTSWEQAVEREFARARRYAQPAAVLMLDLDHFKAINDTHGHATGDAVLRAAAGVLRQLLREQDVPGRYGGEEFGVLLPATDAAGAAAMAERIRGRLDSRPLGGPGVRVTASIGCAALDAADQSASAWIGRADRALYRAKAAGRNRCMSDAPGSRAPSPDRRRAAEAVSE
jgi:diguanylate cyclase